MIDLECMSCQYCGGRLIHYKDHIWQCENCSRFSVVGVSSNSHPQVSEKSEKDSKQSQQPFIITLSFDDEIAEISCSGETTLRFAYRRRATKADRYPSIVTIETSGLVKTCFEKGPPFEFDTVSVTRKHSGFQIIVYQKGRACFDKTVGFGDVISVNRLAIKIEPFNKTAQKMIR